MKFTEVFETIDSTNKYLKEKIRTEKVNPGYSVLAYSQSAGRGRLGRSFVSPLGGLYMSFTLEMDSSMTLTAKASVAVTRALEKVCSVDAQVKWVNDVYVRGKKVCGILAEGADNLVVLGIGVNYCTRLEDIPHDLKDIATSVYDGRQNAPDPLLFAETLGEELFSLSKDKGKAWLNDYKSKSILTGKKVNIIQAGVITGTGIVTGIDDSCALCVQTEDGLIVLKTGEVSIRFAN